MKNPINIARQWFATLPATPKNVSLFVGLLLSLLFTGNVQAQLNSFSPTSGAPGASVNLEVVYNWNNSPTTTSVIAEFSGPGGTWVTATVNSRTSFSPAQFIFNVTVPSGAITGPIRFTPIASNPGTAMLSNGNFTVLPPPPTISVSGSLTAFTTVSGTASTAQSFTVSGSNLTGNITVTAPTGMQVSTSAGSGYATSITLNQSSGTVASTTVFARIAATASPGSITGNISLTSTGASTQNVAIPGGSSVTAQPPTITSFTPTASFPGSSVTITGTNFNPTANQNIVRFNGTQATVTSASATQLVVTVPTAATTGTISVQVTFGSNSPQTVTSSGIFTVTAIPVTVSSFVPTSGVTGSVITINGTGFSTTLSNNQVALNGTPCTVLTATATQLTVAVPSGATSGTLQVDNNATSLSTTTTASYTVNGNEILSFTPASRGIGLNTIVRVVDANNWQAATVPTSVVIEFADGSGGYVSATIGSAAAVSGSPYTYNFTVAVPAGAATGNVRVTPVSTNASVNYTSTTAFTVVPAPVITSVTPAVAMPNQNITLVGTDFTGGTVTVGGINATVVSNTGTQMVVTVPGNATAGPVEVTTPGGTDNAALTIDLTPTVTTIAPNVAAVGQTITLTGFNFNISRTSNIVTIDGITATISTATTTSLVVIVPAGVTNGAISVTNSGTSQTGTATGLTIAVAPVLSANPTSFILAAGQAANIAAPNNAGGSVPAPSEWVAGTVAGLAGSSGSANGSGTTARFYSPYDVATDASGNVYVSDYDNSTIRKIDAAGNVTTFAGTAGSRNSTDGQGTAARFRYPYGIGTDAGGNVYVADNGNHTIRKITPSGSVTTIAGTAGSSGSTNGQGSAARFNSPSDVAADASGNLYVADYGNHVIRKIDPAGNVTTFAGTAGATGSTDGQGSAARFNGPSSVTVDASGNVYVADRLNQLIRKINPSGNVTTLAGSLGVSGSIDGQGSAARFNNPYGVAVDVNGILYVADASNHTIRAIDGLGNVTTVLGRLGVSGSANGSATYATLYNSRGVAVSSTGELFIADYNNHLIRRSSPMGYRVIPALPAGLQLNANGSISGTPTATSLATSYTVVGTNLAGSSSVTYNITVVNPVVVTSFSPAAAGVGATITVTGSGFDAVVANNTVTLNGMAVTVTSATTTQLQFVVPQGATTGTITVLNTATNQAATSASVLTVVPAPTITNINPAAAAVGANITLTGTDLTGGTVTIGGVAATVVSNTGTTMVVTVPVGATSGPVVVTTIGGTDSQPFTVNQPPTIASVSPAAAASGATLTLTGTNYNATAVNNTVMIGGVQAVVVSATTNQLVVTIPAGAANGNIQVTNTATGLSATNTSAFTLILSPSALQYTLPVGGISTQAAVNMPPVVSGSAATYNVQPALPAGLSLNTQTGVITGTPTQTTAPASYVVTATNSAGTTSTTLNFGVGGVPRALAYNPAAATFNVGSPASMAAPALVSFPAATFSVQPALPQGMSINTATGAISGTPTVPVVPARSYVVTATNSFGSTSATLNIGVLDLPPAGISYSPATLTAQPNVAVPASTPAVGGGAVTQWSISPALPAGLVFNTTTGQVSGTLTATGMSGTVTYTITASNSGGQTTATLTIVYSIPTQISGFTAPQGSVVYGSAPLSIAAPQSNSPAPFSYSSSNSSVAQVVNGNQLRITGAGTTTITVSQPAQGSYLAASASYVLNVDRAPLTLTATSTFRCVNSANPQLGYSATGFVNGENASVLQSQPAVSTTATQGSPAGTYPISVGGASAANYTISYVAGVLTVNNAQNSGRRLPVMDAIRGERTQLQARSFGTHYQWSPATGLNAANVAAPTATLTNEVTYTIATTERTGCVVTDTLQVRVFDQPEVFVPNMFSPNGDGVNDVLRINPVAIKQLYYFQVFNRWGKVVFYSRQLSDGWDGRYLMELQPMETYSWILSALDKNGKWIQKTGSVTLVR